MDYKLNIEDVNENLLTYNRGRDADGAGEKTYFNSINDGNEELQRNLHSTSIVSDIDLEQNEPLKSRVPKIEAIDTLKIFKPNRLNPLNQPPKLNVRFTLVFYIALAYAFIYLLTSVIQNIIMIQSSDFRLLIRKTYKCPSPFINSFIYFEVLPPLSFCICYFTIQIIAKRYPETTQVFTFANQSIRITVISFNSKVLKGLVLLIDLMHIIGTIVVINIGNNDPEGLNTCYDEMTTLYVLTYIQIILGFISMIRIVYLIFPHLIGEKLFQYLQRQEQARINGEEKNLSVYSYCDYFRSDLGFTKCHACKKDFNEQERVASLGCSDNHIIHRDCAENWFNQWHHLNCPKCLEFIFKKHYHYYFKH
eukprot:403357284